ncbi:MAG: S-adenosylmethionine decarboxylase [Petroclostridium sp.]|jgi:S-adenosylmethionine decarboxylase|uniref:adenosylmethionine decarboxylase n=1 Tax=Petroclostridium xylanilyticum TaxID=1792311 RepID=UPI000B9826AC|nr:adenosylmethionine decarboxylase [Petroclostridium xylanilyticum]MBZ4646513.1 S-adenosylmethionine decarboxylase proenzyme [Clostridia bacterium]MDK2810140.1 S-adenosylmethionine decarboxylase [Petroclostridium sp.]
MDTYSRHSIIELWECNRNFLDNRELVEKIMVQATLEAGAEIREVTFHKFTPQGISGAIIISESHLTIHTFPEHGYASVDVFTCGDRIDPGIATKIIARKLGSKRTYEINLERGLGEILITGKYETKSALA